MCILKVKIKIRNIEIRNIRNTNLMHQYTIQSILRHNQHQQKHTKNTHNIYKFTLYTEHPLTLWGWDTPAMTPDSKG